MCGDRDCDERIERRPAGDGDGAHAQQHARGRPHVRHEVIRIGFERDRLVLPACSEQYARDGEVDERRDERQREPDSELLEWFRVKQAIDRRSGDAERREQYERAFDTARQVLGLVVSVRMVFVRRARSDGDRDEGHTRGRKIDQRLERVRKQPHRAGEHVREAFEADDDARGDDREPRDPNQR
jgi:hypothetical protein